MRSQYRSSLLIWALGLTIFAVTLGITAWWGQGRAVIDTQVNGATVNFSADPSVVLMRGDCTTVTWAVEQVSGVFVEGEGVIGSGEKPVCVHPNHLPRLTITVPDDPRVYPFDLPVIILSEMRAVQAAFWGMMILVGLGVWRLPVGQRWWEALGDGGRLHVVLLIGIIAVGVAFRLAYLDRGVAFDEGWTLLEFVRQESFYAMISDYEEPNNHILHSILVRLLDQWLGHAPWIFRFPAFAAGVLMIPAGYWLGQRFYNRDVGLLTAALIATTYPAVNYSVEARGYTLLTLITMLLLLVAHRLKQTPAASPGLWGSFSVLAALGFYTIPIMIYPMGIVALWLLVSIALETRGGERRGLLLRAILALIGGAALTVLLYTPVLRRNADWLFNNFMAQPQAGTLVDLLWESAGLAWSFLTANQPLVLAVLLLGGTLIALVAHHRLTTDRLPLHPVVVVWVALVVIQQRIAPPDRVWLYLVPIYTMTAAAGIIAAGTWLVRSDSRRIALFAVLAPVLMALQMLPILQRDALTHSPYGVAIPGAETVIQYLIAEDTTAGRLNPRDSVITRPTADQSLHYYIELHRLDEAIMLTHYLYAEDVADMRAGRRIFVYGNLWDSLDDFLAERGIDLPPVAVNWEVIEVYGEWALYELIANPDSGV